MIASPNRASDEVWKRYRGAFVERPQKSSKTTTELAEEIMMCSSVTYEIHYLVRESTPPRKGKLLCPCARFALHPASWVIVEQSQIGGHQTLGHPIFLRPRLRTFSVILILGGFRI